MLYTVAEISVTSEQIYWEETEDQIWTFYLKEFLWNLLQKNWIIQSKERKKIKYREELAAES